MLSLLGVATGAAVLGPVAGVLAFGTGAAPDLVDPTTPADAQPLGGVGRGALVFSDEFNGSVVDAAKWTVRDEERTEPSRTDGFRWWYKPSTVRVAEGNLAIDIAALGHGVYAGGRIDSHGKFDFTYGTIEFRIRFPPTQGHLSAAWLQASRGLADGARNAARGAEIDLIESNFAGDEYTATIHYGGYGAGHIKSAQRVNAPGLHSGYHTIGLSWSPSTLEFRYDGKPVRTVTDPALISTVAEFPILSQEILQWAQGSIADAPLDRASTLYVDYVRVWQ
ncbi:glycoside hydrolase family 16 protein [Prescottella soli]|uniref:glycoside hydrolase family 16 protein n=1 Tax=Prescottella soli TaxID=1543852 RepID=UPI0032AF4832